VLAGQGGERIARVLAPKVTGADLLDRLSRNLPLDHFVLFSSSAALIGSAAQANHAAALRRAMAGDQPTLGIMDVDWATFCARYGAHLPPFLDEVRPRQAQARTMAAAPVATAAPASDLGRLPPEQRFDGLVRAVRATAARILGLPGAEAVAADAPLRDLGLDSLMTVELRNALAALASAKLPATLVFDHPTCAELARHLAEGPMAAIVPAPAERGDGFDELDTDELAALLEQELAAAGRHLDEAVG
jgi:acyl carrier protein